MHQVAGPKARGVQGAGHAPMVESLPSELVDGARAGEHPCGMAGQSPCGSEAAEGFSHSSAAAAYLRVTGSCKRAAGLLPASSTDPADTRRAGARPVGHGRSAGVYSPSSPASLGGGQVSRASLETYFIPWFPYTFQFSRTKQPRHQKGSGLRWPPWRSWEGAQASQRAVT